MARMALRALWAMPVILGLMGAASPARVPVPLDSFGVPVTPYGSASGTYAIEWTYISGPQSIPRITVHGRVDYAVDRRFRTRTEEYAWLRESLPDMPDWLVKRLRSGVANFGLDLRAHLVSARVTITEDQTCDNGVAARKTTTVERISHPHAALATVQPTINLLARRGTADIDPAWTVLRDGVIRLAQAAYGAGDVETKGTGTDCSGMNETGSIPASISTTEHRAITELLGGGDGIVSAVDSHHSLPVRVARGGGTSLTGTFRLADFSRRQDGESFRGAIHVNLRFGGPPLSQQAICELPMQQIERVRSLRAARALLRRAGFPSAPFGGSRRYSFHRPTFYLKSASGLAYCGAPLGSRRFPVLYRDPGR